MKARAESARRSVEAQTESLRERHASVRIAYEAYERDRRQAGALLAGGLAYRLFLWLLPAALFAVAVIGLFADATSRSPEEAAEATGLGASLAVTVAQAVEQSGRGSIYLLVLGGVLMVWAGRSAVKGLRLTSAVAWGIRPPAPPRSWMSALVFSGVTFGVLLVPNVLLPFLHGGAFVVDLLAEALVFVALTALLVWVQDVMPHEEGITWSAFVPGAAVCTAGAFVLRIVTDLYFAGRLGRVDDLYGALGIAAVFMAWLYLIGRLLVAMFAVSATRWRAQEGEETGPSAPG
ncbi:MAG: YhjD/YihY/BrkB family envelope integrity protein [Longimicrobiales bacterium]